MLEGGKTPVLSPLELEDMGFQLAVYPLSLLGVSMRAMQVWILNPKPYNPILKVKNVRQ